MTEEQFRENCLYLAFLAVVMGAFIAGYFVWRKTVHDAAIAKETARIADAAEASIPSRDINVDLKCNFRDDHSSAGHWRVLSCAGEVKE